MNKTTLGMIEKGLHKKGDVLSIARLAGIMGAKKMLNLNRNKLDDYQSDSLKAEYYKENIKLKSKLLLNKINKIKKNGKKNTY